MKAEHTKINGSVDNRILEHLLRNPKSYKRDLSQNIDSTYSHISKRVDLMVKDGLVEQGEKVGRSKPVYLTDKGEKVAQHINKISMVLNDKLEV